MNTAAPTTAQTNLHSAWARLFVHALVESGVTRFVVSPGSRSTPLVLALSQEAEANPRVSLDVVVDERSAAFLALGQARATGEPSALVCTSGTAGAHYFPAIIEASESFVPLVVVTADRPWEAYDAGAPQTIDQVKLFGDHVRSYADLGVPDASPAALRAVPRIAAQAAARARGPVPGPVHVNARFRKPLEPVAVSAREPWHDAVDALMARGTPRVARAASALDESVLTEAADRVSGAKSGIIVCGPASAHGDLEARRTAVATLARATGFPVFAEATSQVRFGAVERGATVCAAFDAMLREPEFAERFAPEVIVEIGAPAVSTAYGAWLGKRAPACRVVLAEHGWGDWVGGADVMIRAELAAACSELAAHVRRQARAQVRASCTELAELAARADACVWRAVSEEMECGVLTEGRVARDVVAALPEGSTLVVSNSNPVRDVDTYAPASRRALRVIHQRGASGIDGLVSGAAGARGAISGPMALLLGDLALVHDLGGLAALARAKGPLAVVVVQNGGGRIFEQLPIGGAVPRDVFERLFATPVALDVERACSAFGIAYRGAKTPADLAAALGAALEADRPLIVEAHVEPRSAERRATIWREWPRRTA